MGGVLFADFADPTAPKIEKIHADGVLPEGMTLCVTDTRASHSELTGEFAAIRNEMEPWRPVWAARCWARWTRNASGRSCPVCGNNAATALCCVHPLF